MYYARRKEVSFHSVHPIQNGPFLVCSQMEGVQKGAPSLKSVTHILQ